MKAVPDDQSGLLDCSIVEIPVFQNLFGVHQVSLGVTSYDEYGLLSFRGKFLIM